MQKDLIESLRRKDVIISPTPSLMAQIEEFLEYNMLHYRDPDHFLKADTFIFLDVKSSCPNSSSAISTKGIQIHHHAESLFAQSDTSMDNVKHPVPYTQSLTFWSDAHPCFVLSFTVLASIIRVWRPSILEQLPAGIVDCLTFVSCGPNPSFYCRPYPGWHP